MRIAPILIVTALAAALACAGCKQGDRAATAAPTLEELPVLKPPPRVSAVQIGVEGRAPEQARIIVPTYEKIEPTPEEQQILGIKDPPLPDALVLYRPPPTPERGISSESTELYGINEPGGIFVGREKAVPRYWNYGFAGRGYGTSLFDRVGAGVGRPRETPASTAFPWTMLAGEGELRQPAARETQDHR